MSLIERAADKIQKSGAKSPQAHEALASEKHQADQQRPGAEALVERIAAEMNASDTNIKPPVSGHRKIHIDIPRLQSTGSVPPESSRERLESEYRRVKRPLLSNISGRGAVPVEKGRIIMVTSAQPNEGKTFTAFNLARSLAQEPDWDVVLVDADNVRRTLSDQLGLEDQPGLVDVLGDAALNVDDVLFSTDIPRLSFITCGRRDALSSEYLSSRRMDDLIDQLTKVENRIVLIDAPPLLGTSDALSLSEVAGQILLVVRAGRTPRAAVAEAIQPLDRRKAINVVLNQVVKSHGDTYGGYSHYYGYGYSESDRARPARSGE